ncbi:MAG: hypothetical protein JRI97_00185 [Deltaproteobacteria bacterium]|nr:hypothetical protein [Deltaproteobacteria bacterium]
MLEILLGMKALIVAFLVLGAYLFFRRDYKKRMEEKERLAGEEWVCEHCGKRECECRPRKGGRE